MKSYNCSAAERCAAERAIVSRAAGFSRIVVGTLFEALTGLSGKQFYSATHRVLKDRERLYIAPLQEHPAWQPVMIPVATGELTQPLPLSFQLLERTPDFQMERTPDIAYFDADKLPDTLSLRLPQRGDWFVPFGMRGRKKLKIWVSVLLMEKLLQNLFHLKFCMVLIQISLDQLE